MKFDKQQTKEMIQDAKKLKFLQDNNKSAIGILKFFAQSHILPHNVRITKSKVLSIWSQNHQIEGFYCTFELFDIKVFYWLA